MRSGPIPYTILRSTQFFDFARRIAEWNTRQDTVHVPSRPVQPVAASDVADALIELALHAPLDGAMEIAGPEAMPLPDFVDRVLRMDHDPRYVVSDDLTAPVGFNISADLLLPRSPLRIAPTSLASWVHDEGRCRLTGVR